MLHFMWFYAIYNNCFIFPADGHPTGSSDTMESQAEFEDLDTLINMIDGDFDDDVNDGAVESTGTPSSSFTSPLPTHPTSSSLPPHSSSSSPAPSSSTLPSHSSTSPASTPTAAELGLVLSDDEDQCTVSTTTSTTKKSKFGEAFAQSKFSNGLPPEKKGTSQDSTQSCDPLEAELQEMEERVKRLKQQLSNKRKFDGEEGSSSKRFSKLTNVIPQGVTTSQTTRTLSSEETSQLYSKLKKNSALHGGDTDSEDEEDNRNPMEQQYSDFGRDIKRRIAHESSQADDRDRERVLARVKRKEQLQTGGKVKEPQSQGWKGTSGSLVALKNGGSALPDTDKNVSTDFYSGIRIV